MMLESDNSEESSSDRDTSVDYTLIFLLIISLALVALDVVELSKVVKNFELAKTTENFETCLKYEYFTKGTFGLFSFLAAVSAVVLTFGLLVNAEIFIQKFMDTFLYLNYLIFGPYMLAMTVLGMMQLEHTMFICDKTDPSHKYFSFTNIVSTIICGSISLLIVLVKTIYDSATMFNNSIIRRDGGSLILHKLFWWIVTRNRNNNRNNI
jgi:hypothetical protein